MSEAAVRAEGLAQSFGTRLVFQGVNLQVARGEIFAVLGGSGSGKSTLLRQLVGLLPLQAGSARVMGYDVVGETASVRRQVGVLFQSGALFGSLSLLENVMLPLRSLTDLPREACAAIARLKLAQVGLGDATALRPAEISGGMAKRCGIARALALDPPLLLLDEPSAGLDPVTSAGLDALVLQLRDTLGASFVIVTHELASVFAVADRCLLLSGVAHGVVAEGTPQALARDSEIPEVRAFFRREAG